MTQVEFEKAFKELFTPLSGVAYVIVKDQDTAKDIVQQVFINLWNKLDKINIKISTNAYLHRAVVNTSLNYLEKNKRYLLEENMQNFDEADDKSGNAELQLQEKEAHEKIKLAISKLPAKCQTVFSLSRYTQMSNKEIADHMGISIKAVEKHISKALKSLRKDLAGYAKASGIAVLLFILILFSETGRVAFENYCHISGGKFYE